MGASNAQILSEIPLGYQQTAAEIAAGVTPTNLFIPNHAACGFVIIDRYGTNTTPGTTDMTSAINAAQLVAQQFAGIVKFLGATYAHASTLVFKNGLVYEGSGQLSTVLKYTGTSDQIQVNNPINSSTNANYEIRDMTLQSVNATTGKANLADVGSTYIYLRRVNFLGAAINLILDQSEIVRVTDCLFNNVQANGAGAWLVNGSEHTPGANSGFTNDILFIGCQFNGATTGTGVADDGGGSHKFIANDFNALTSQIRCTTVNSLVVEACEMEAGVQGVDFELTKWGGNAGGASNSAKISGNLFSVAGNSCIKVGASGALTTLEFTDNTINSASGVFNGLSNVTVDVVSYNNTQIGSGTGYYQINNYFAGSGPWTMTWSATGGSPAIGNGSFTLSYTRKGTEVTIRFFATFGTTTTFAGTAWNFSLPVTASTELLDYLGSGMASVAGTSAAAVTPFITSGGTAFYLGGTGGTGNWGNAVPGAWTSGDYIRAQITYKAANWVG